VVAPRPRVVLSPPLPPVVRAGTVLSVTGRVLRGPRGIEVALQARSPTGGPWRILITGRPPRRAGRFRLRWRVRSAVSREIVLRVAALEGSTVVASSRAVPELIGPAPRPCRAPVPPGVVPAGDGWITGGVYIEGGPAPGVDECQSSSSTVTVTDAAGAVVASATVPGGASYTFVVAPGSYTLSTGFCRGSATVVAGAATIADTVCAVP